MTPLRHEMILASAGSGKTFALTDRFVALLARGAKPERIVALTFTRKAAGEFFDEILKKLAGAAGDAEAAGRLAQSIGAPELGPANFLALLRTVTDAMHRLRLGTLDSFFGQIARAFPLELGLTGDFEILQEHAARLERQRVLRRMFARAGGLAPEQQEFIGAFKRATFGREEKRLGAQLDGFLDDYQETFLAAPVAELWGNPARIWPEGSAWLEPAGRLAGAVAALGAALAGRELSDGQRRRWEDFFAALPEWAPGMDLPKPLDYVLKNALAVWPALRAGGAEMTVERKKLALGPDECAALARIVTEIVGAELRRRLETTRGIFAVLRGYESVYHDAVRRAGKLTFSDVQRLLAPAAGAPLLAQRDDGGDGRLQIDYRLDAEIDHWLLDEFQDTSFGQWSVLRNLIDEAVQDAEGRRTFFCVGDVKQAVYAWREGDPQLFREIFAHYNAAAPGAIVERPLVQSWRSGPPLIAMVNAVFGAGEALARLFPGEAGAAWNRVWLAHTTAVPDRNGQAALLHAEDEPARWAAALRLLREIRPLERGLTCAVLVKRNATATALADYLRREGGLPAVAESDLHVCTDNPPGAALLALVQAAAHPGDSLAWEHVQMTPLGAVLAAEGLDRRERLTGRVLGQIHADGFERMAEWWLGKLEARLAADDVFSRGRARQFAAAAGLFDATGSRDVAEFVAFMERHTVRDAESAAVVRVMTVHKAKGLGFDVVLLPDLEGNTLEERRKGLAVQKAPDRSVEWVLDLPSELFRQQDPVLAAHVGAARAAACYENLSLLYVAMTRAKRGLYVITKPPGKSASANFPRVLAETLGAETQPVRVGAMELPGAWSAGDPDWHRACAHGEPAGGGTPAPAGIGPVAGLHRAPRRQARRPSAEKKGELDAARLFALEGGGAADFGTAVHAHFAEVEFAGAADAGRFAAAWADGGPAAEEALACLREPALAAVWARPGGAAPAEVWRERSFEIVLDGAWVTGVFDRVVLERSDAGHPVRATVWDFKTDRTDGAAGVAEMVARHAGQLHLYRRVAAVLAGIDVQRVVCELVLTRLRRRAAVPPPDAR
jgi:ATP-dependent exoDNAse (exonuclease V) beta subunit